MHKDWQTGSDKIYTQMNYNKIKDWKNVWLNQWWANKGTDESIYINEWTNEWTIKWPDEWNNGRKIMCKQRTNEWMRNRTLRRRGNTCSDTREGAFGYRTLPQSKLTCMWTFFICGMISEFVHLYSTNIEPYYQYWTNMNLSLIISI